MSTPPSGAQVTTSVRLRWFAIWMIFGSISVPPVTYVAIVFDARVHLLQGTERPQRVVLVDAHAHALSAGRGGSQDRAAHGEHA